MRFRVEIHADNASEDAAARDIRQRCLGVIMDGCIDHLGTVPVDLLEEGLRCAHGNGAEYRVSGSVHMPTVERA